ncbi:MULTISPECIES: enoyl-CoA hydratase/isomerase family protein [Acinetobacter]|uniref:enoyl-CoA hydratase/isomerase family protein n=1 Tax=Acinetobacter TaxID=469 RepID=UPI000DAE9B75|nr:MULTISPECIES: enoyl-CoA hydratase/isomerase family protein [Acinetobacter]AWV86025.1 enoyl-CoA hydratase/isomerase family protein [Acinetobacter radioresistens]MCK4080561.1 enoyl-CoA hydratase/isomerase family protein [Acinetobacter radioresistens]MCK4089221.1 enoyl-CoA hydratase/isomerase family protein [Acinetobacter radioresistens]MCX0326737.1 enoyl-CoA hydratase/isomerase family protein [Acinetobacter radioresistens]RJL72869.1 enoyl-CoA hydratase/isomerase family protein [Acinetobacter 
MTNSPSLNSYHPDLVVEAADNGWRIVRLNRPKSLHALDESIVSALLKAFEDFQHDDQVKAIWLDSTTPKAFCAGGDVRKLRQLVINHEVDTANRFFEQEYALDLLIHNYAKPILVWGEGYVMGGGLGLFMAAPFRLVTPYSRLAMPEINIGLYPDVGASRFLADRGPIGLFTGLTGSIMTSAGAYGIGWATHICDAQRDVVLQKVISIDWNHYPAGSFRAIDDTLNSLHRPVAPGPLQNSLDVIHSVCRGINFEQDYQAIIGLSDARSDWLRQASENLQKGSPATAALTWLLWQWGRQVHSWNEVFELELQISNWKIRHPDFVEGVRARLVDKDLSPEWKQSADLSLRSILGDQPPVTTNESWNRLLKQYQVID